jgi:hypothetical protein|tara:strand:+ start:3216 stop:3383 length:168 start_codon:yes stop_codon:yes gene_type:complete
MGYHTKSKKKKKMKMKAGGSTDKPTPYAIGGMLDKKLSKMGGGMLAAMNIKRRNV